MGKSCLPYLQKECAQSQLPDIPSQSAAAAFVTSTMMGSSRSQAPSEISRTPSVMDRTNASLLRHMGPLEAEHGVHIPDVGFGEDGHDDSGSSPPGIGLSSTLPPGASSPLGFFGSGNRSPGASQGRPVARSVSDTRRGRADADAHSLTALAPPQL